MKQITIDYFELIKELKQRVAEKNIIEILNVVDKIKLFWNKQKTFITNELNNKKEISAIIGCMTYPHFNDNHHFLPLAHNKLLIIDEPISKMDELIRAQEFNNTENILDILTRTINMFLNSRDIISNENIVIVPLRLYYGIDANNLHKLANKLVYASLSYMFDKEIVNDKDIAELSAEYNTFEKIDNFVSNTSRDILFLGTDTYKLSLSERIKKYYENSGLNFDNVSSLQPPILFIVTAIYGYSAQICDIVNTCECTNSDLYIFIEIPAFYFNILLENIYSSDKKSFDKYLKTIIGYYLQQYLIYTNFNNLNLNEFCNKYDKINLLNSIQFDYVNKRAKTTNETDFKLIKDIIETKVNEFYK